MLLHGFFFFRVEFPDGPCTFDRIGNAMWTLNLLRVHAQRRVGIEHTYLYPGAGADETWWCAGEVFFPVFF